MARPKRDLTKITVNLPTSVLALIDGYAELNHITRTTAISALCCYGLHSQGCPSKEEVSTNDSV